MTLDWITAWFNLIFVMPFLLALAYLGVYTASGWTFGEADADVDGDAEVSTEVPHADVHVEADADVDGDADLDHDLDADADADQDADGDAHAGVRELPWHLDVLTWLGVGRVPLSIVLMILLFTWGFIGFTINQLLRDWMPHDWMVAVVSLPVAFLGSVCLTSLIGNTVGRYMPMTETYARPKQNLVGRVGEAILPIDETFGMVGVHDASGSLIQVPCRVAAEAQSIRKGSKVLLFSYNERQGVFYGSPYELPAPEREVRG